VLYSFYTDRQLFENLGCSYFLYYSHVLSCPTQSKGLFSQPSNWLMNHSFTLFQSFTQAALFNRDLGDPSSERNLILCFKWHRTGWASLQQLTGHTWLIKRQWGIKAWLDVSVVLKIIEHDESSNFHTAFALHTGLFKARCSVWQLAVRHGCTPIATAARTAVEHHRKETNSCIC